MLVVLTGGARSGKSTAAVRLAAAAGAPVVFVATAEAGDAEMTARIERHQAERPADWTTVEAPAGLAEAVAGVDNEATVIVDCLSMWVSNEMLTAEFDGEPGLIAAAEALEAALSCRSGLSILVTNEVGSGIVPDNPLGRDYRDLLGTVNQRFVAAADRAFLVVAGRLLELTDPANELST